ncbi:MAG: hypothetical protein IT491_14925 [Gammaproteobacteria bacterium]|nr:hypothetical protein [Gammaproteobacteria bacterium]
MRVSADRAAPSNEPAQRDREMEERWCAAHRELLRQLEQRGMPVNRCVLMRRGNYRCNGFNRMLFNTPLRCVCGE